MDGKETKASFYLFHYRNVWEEKKDLKETKEKLTAKENENLIPVKFLIFCA